MLLDDITKGISKTLKNRFSNKKIYIDEVPQDFVEPCFFIKLLKLDEKQVIGERYFRRYFFDIRYFPDKIFYYFVNFLKAIFFIIFE